MTGKKEYPSMGCQVEEHSCKACDDDGITYFTPKYPIKMIRDVEYSFSMVPAPRCEACGESMKYLNRSTQWACQDEGCKACGEAIETGIGGIVE